MVQMLLKTLVDMHTTQLSVLKSINTIYNRLYEIIKLREAYMYIYIKASREIKKQ
jgi:hypothetical protein